MCIRDRLYPEYDQTCVGIAAAHIPDQLQFFLGMLVGLVTVSYTHLVV